MPDIDTAKKPAPLPEELQRYHDAYAELARTFRLFKVAESGLEQVYNELLVEFDVPVGHGIDVHGDGQIKKKAECAKPEEVN